MNDDVELWNFGCVCVQGVFIDEPSSQPLKQPVPEKFVASQYSSGENRVSNIFLENEELTHKNKLSLFGYLHILQIEGMKLWNKKNETLPTTLQVFLYFPQMPLIFTIFFECLVNPVLEQNYVPAVEKSYGKFSPFLELYMLFKRLYRQFIHSLIQGGHFSKENR